MLNNLYNSGLADFTDLKNVWETDKNSVLVRVYNTSSNLARSFYFYFLNLDDNNVYMYKDGNSIYFTSSIPFKRVTLTINVSSNTASLGNIENFSRSFINVSTYNFFDNINPSAFLISDEYIYTDSSHNVVTSSNYYYKKKYSLENPTFTLANNIAGSYSVYQITLGDFADVDYSKIENITLENDSVGYLNLSSGLFIRNNRLFVETRYLKFNQDYHLQIEYNYDIGEGFLYNGVFRISSTDGSSGDVPFTNQDSTNYIINNQEKTTQDVITSLTAPADVSGELSKYLSGDTILGEIGFNSIEIDSRMMEVDDFYTALAQEIRQLLLQDSDYTVTFNWAGTNITLNSRDFTTPESIVKDFSRGFLTFVSIMLFFKYIVGLIHRIQDGNFSGIVYHASVNDDSILL